MADISAYRPGIGIGKALRDLPLETPDRSAWPLLSNRITKKSVRRFLPLAMAAGIALLAAIPMSLHSPGAPGNQTDPSLLSLMRQSSQLENILLATRNSTASNASAEVLGLALEDRIHAIDADLASSSLTSAQQLDLWQQRIGILQEATGIYSSQRYQQAEGRPYDIAMVESF